MTKLFNNYSTASACSLPSTLDVSVREGERSSGVNLGSISRPAGPEMSQTEAENLPSLHSFAPKEVADELSLLDAGLLRMIKTSELENGVWMKKDKVGHNIMRP